MVKAYSDILERAKIINMEKRITKSENSIRLCKLISAGVFIFFAIVIVLKFMETI